ncbi:glutamine-rich protein 2 isoform X1 [Globicephala melas]|uniref:glutamine-rich protein 2 isoform X1 n=1 Tax=Globicephala melas TaxID=9731 RepID=UPI00293D710A|nr:glutamine-rich protein 2 isoform X1 [Globicephala melas]
MPPGTTAAPSVSLRELADLAIGTPEVGAVNFTALHTLIVAMLKNLNLQDTRIDFPSPMLEQSRLFESPRVSSSRAQLQALESQVEDLGGQVQDLSLQLETMGGQVQAIVQNFPSQAGGLDARDWLEMKDLPLLTEGKAQVGSTKVRKDGEPVPKGMELLQDIKEDAKILKEAQQKAKEQPELHPEKLLQRVDELEKLMRERDKFLEIVSWKLRAIPDAEEATMVTWEELEQAVTGGRMASQMVSESSTRLPRRKGQGSMTSNDKIPSGASTKHPSVDEAIESASGFGTDETSGTSGIGYSSEGVTGREQSKGASATGFPGREEHSRSREEAGLTKHRPQLRAESDRRRAGEQHGLAHLRRDERDAHLGPVYQDVSSATLPRALHGHVSPDQHGGVHVSQGQVYARPDQHGLGPLGMNQPASLQPSTYAHGAVPLAVGQLGVTPPGMDEQELVLAGMAQSDAVPPLVSGRDQQGLGLPGTDQPGMVPLGTYQHGVILPGIDQHGIKQAGMDESGVGPLGTDQHGLVPLGVDQHGFVIFGTDQQGLLSPGLMQVAADQQGFVQPSLGTSGFIQPGTEQHDTIQPSAGQPALVQPSIGQPGLVQPGAGQPGLVQPGAGQPGLVQPGAAGQPGLVQPGAAGQPGLVQPGAGQPGLVQPGTGQPGLVQPGAGQPGLVQPGTGQPGLVQPGTGQPGLVQPGAGQPGLVQPGTGQPGLVQPGAGQPGLVQPGAGQPGLVQPGAGQPGLVQPGAAGQPGLVQPGAAGQPGLVQPGAGQPGLVQPGAGQPGLVQPGAGQPGLVQPGAGQPGLVQPDTGSHGFFQPGVSVPGLVPPGTYPPGLVQPGGYPHGLVQSGAYPRGFMQPHADQRGLVQPVIDQHWLRQSGTDQGLIPPGTELHGFPTYHADPRSFISPRPYQHGVAPPGRDQYGRVSPLVASQGLASPSIDREGLVPRETYQQGLMRPGPDQRGPKPLRTGVGSARQDQQHLEAPEPEQHDRAHSVPDSHGPGYQGVDQYVEVGLDPNEIRGSVRPGVSVQTSPSQGAPLLRSTRSLDYLYRGLSERSDVQGEKRDSLDKLAPSFPMAVETFRLLGELIGLYLELKENVKDLDDEQAGQTDLEKIQYLLTLMVKKSIPADLQEQLKTLKALTKEVQQEKAKLEKVNRILEGEGEQETGKEVNAGQLSLQLDVLRVTVADIEKELAELRESQERGKVSMEHSVSEASLYLQDQLDKLRTIIENMMASSSTLLSMSMSAAPHKLPTTLAPSQIDPAATCPACSLDLSHRVSTLVQRYEQLQDMVSSLAASRPSKKAKQQSQDEELLGRVQSAILQVQGDCEKLSIITGNLIEDHRQRQKDIEVLYQGLEKLQKEKANREHLELEINVKADKSALAAKVSRVQFDATTEQLNHMMQELVAKMSGREGDWQKMLDRLLVQMDNKVRGGRLQGPLDWDNALLSRRHRPHLLPQSSPGPRPHPQLDRLELDPVKQSLEDGWKSLRLQLKERSPLYQVDEAAAMRRQLLAHFHCLSCDRPLEMPVTGQVIPLTPVGPGLPGHRSIRPYTVFELEQVRQQSRNLQLGSAAFPWGNLGQTERSAGRLRSLHSKMLMDIEKVQIHFGGSVKASSQMIRELLRSQCLGCPCYRRLPDAADHTYGRSPRSCGGSHTLTYPSRRTRLQHLAQGLYPTEETQIARKHDEVDILGLDGHIYKGRMDTRLPDILNKDNSGIKHKAKQSRPHVHRQQSLSDSGQLPSRSQSAQMLAGNDSGSSSLDGRSWPRHYPLPLLLGPPGPFPAHDWYIPLFPWREEGPGS